MSCDRYCSVALPHGAMGWSVVCGCGISDHTHLLFHLNILDCILLQVELFEPRREKTCLLGVDKARFKPVSSASETS